MRIGELAAAAGVKIPTVRFYERTGLLPDPERCESGYRIYGPRDLQRMRFIRGAARLGFSLDEIRPILAARENGQRPCEGVIAIAERHHQELESRIAEMQGFLRELSKILGSWRHARPRQGRADAICELIERAAERLPAEIAPAPSRPMRARASRPAAPRSTT